ncbi:hypothetical protein PGT21_001575 [Puccinia graminis f. sp. tritici]|uniref:Uncharacterized protein n=1 Tax=Puccinia graminis f. sp. tritici TaxID=56615 RepID=A0A5B0NRW6_PUCGR|nr:hypothetical protein PGT21_001575 [Puccinia graminis f. sp. tritici]
MTSPPSPYIKSEYNISTTPELFASSASLDSPPSLPPLPKPSLSDFIAVTALPD